MTVTETLHGFIETTQDALLVFEGCRRGLLPRTSRRLQEKERRMIQSGSIFVFDERESGIKRWTDGRMWSPSRILGNFLIYREVSKRFPGIGDRRRSSTSSSASSCPQSGDMRQRSYSADHTNRASLAVTDRGRERQLVGSLSDVHAFRKDGLIKKTVSIVVSGVAQHLISYYHPRDVLRGELRNPTSMPHLAALEISPDLIQQNFRVALSIDGSYSSSDMVTSALLSYPLSPSGTGDCQQQQQPQQQQRLHNQLRSMSVGSSYGYGESSTISSSFYSNALADAAADQKFSHMGFYTVPHPQQGAVGLGGGSPFTSASMPLLPSSVRHPFDGSGNGGGHGIMTTSPYSPSDPTRQHLRGVPARNVDGSISDGVQPTYRGATVMHPLHNGHHLGSSFTVTGDPTTFENFHSSQSEYSNRSSSVTDNTTLPGPSLFGFTTEVHAVATGAAGTQHHHHQQYEHATTVPSSHMLSGSLYYPSSTC